MSNKFLEVFQAIEKNLRCLAVDVRAIRTKIAGEGPATQAAQKSSVPARTALRAVMADAPAPTPPMEATK